jgi:thymidine kinase
MAKLYFRYGVVGSAKTLNLLAVAHNYKQQRKNILLVKPEIDTRFGVNIIGTRAGLKTNADIIVPEHGKFTWPDLSAVSCILVDEVQFMPVTTIERFYHMAHNTEAAGIPVICYGLRTDFRLELFPASKRLMELADTIEEVKTTCNDCDRKAIFNLKLQNNEPVLDGPSIELGFEETYIPVCALCYERRHQIKLKEKINRDISINNKSKGLQCPTIE